MFCSSSKDHSIASDIRMGLRRANVKNIVLLLGLLCWAVVLYVYVPTGSLPSFVRGKQVCSSFFSAALQLLVGASFSQGAVDVCVLGQDKTLPADVSCAIPNAVLTGSSNRTCAVRYSDIKHLTEEETRRQFEASTLLLGENAVLLQKSNPLVLPLGRKKEASAVVGNELLLVAVGEKLVFPSSARCKLKILRKPASKMGYWVMMSSEADVVFLDTAKAYAAKQDYGVLSPVAACSDAFNDLPQAWHKIVFAKMALAKLRKKGYGGWILWLDSTALISNDEFKLDSILNSRLAGKKGVLLVGQDAKPPFLLNMGVLLVKVSQKSDDMLDSVWRCGVAQGWMGKQSFYWDQNALTHLADHGRRFAEFAFWGNGIRLLPHRMLISFMRQDGVEEDIESAHWKFGDFIALISSGNYLEAVVQAHAVKRLTQFSSLQWRGKPYVYPSLSIAPPLYSLPLDSFFRTAEPAWLMFTGHSKDLHFINPSCLWDLDYLHVNCVVRQINYGLNVDTGEYDWKKQGKSVDYFFRLTEEQFMRSPGKVMLVGDAKEMFVAESIKSRMQHNGMPEGFEDVKLVRTKTRTYGVCTSLQFNSRGQCEITLMSLNEHRLADATPLRGYKEGDCHKNWMPFVEGEDEMFLVEQVDPLVVVKPVGGQASVVLETKEALFPTLRLRGTSNGIKFGAGHLFVVHETITRGKFYAHRFLYVEKSNNWKRRLSRPFYAVRNTVEFLIGLQISKDQSKLVLGFGFEDVKSGFMTVEIESPKVFLPHSYFWI